MAFAALPGCERPAPSGDAEPWFEALAAGAFLPRHPWLDFAELHRIESDEEKQSQAWRVPYGRWIEVTDGWGGAEHWGAWGLGESTRLRFFLGDVGPYDVFVRAMAPPDPAQRPQQVAVRINGEDAGTFTADDEWADYRVSVPDGLLRRGWNELELVPGYHLEKLADDDRPLALGFETLGLLPPGRKPAAPGRGQALRIYYDQEVLVIEAPGSYVVPLDVPPDATALELEASVSGGRGAARLDAAVMRVDGHREAAVPLLAEAPARLDLVPYRGARILLTLDAEVPEGERLTIRRPSLVRGSGEPAARPTVRTAAAGEPPPVVLIVIDAARADHFGVYGYERDTTPHIDALAEQSLVFENAVAECSYTLCSMPNLLTGLSYVQHGMVAKQLVLKDEVETLAEKLQKAGYLTLGYTGNPNNSSVTRLDQGFDEYSEIWKVHPDHITQRFTQRLRRTDLRKRPFFLMLHFVPPHEPYDPDPEFDLFGDPDYDGPVTSDRQFTRAVYAQEIELDEDDLAEMVALYDGNLRMADAAVGQVLDLLKENGLFDDALVIVTSDHGEAFLEHGRVGHNSTIYDEMLRVPLVVKLPRGISERAAGVDVERLVSLADVPATILGLAGLELAPDLRALDLLATESSNGASGDRLVYLRSAQVSRPVLGVRTSRFKALNRSGAPPELYDITADPGETSNVLDEHPLLHTGLSLLLAREVRQPGGLRAGVREGEIPEKDQAMLRALGYL